MRNIQLHNQLLAIKIKNVKNFQLKNNLKIFVIFRIYVNISTFKNNKKNLSSRLTFFLIYTNINYGETCIKLSSLWIDQKIIYR